MKDIFKLNIFIWILMMMTIYVSGNAQQEFSLDKNPKMVVEGTSSLHDWEMVSNTANGSALLTLSNGKITGMESAKISMDVNTLKSGRGGMDNNAYKALNADKNPTIIFTLKKAVLQGNRWKVTGNLEMAGATKEVQFEVQTAMEGSKVKITGQTAFKLTDFGVDPPTAVFGTIKTGDEVRLNVEMKLIP
ncbi:MAG: YceI family protein [Cyclobacteriaceae bacterium]